MKRTFCIALAIVTTAAVAESKYDLGPKLSPQEIAAKEAAQKAEDAERDFAKSACIYYVKRRLNDPSSAEFPVGEEERARDARGVKQKNGSWKVTFTGRARNGFNAIVRTTFQCEVSPVEVDGKKNMMVTSSKQVKS